MGQLNTITSNIREIMFYKCEALIQSTRPGMDDAELKRWLCVDRTTYLRLLSLVRIPLSQKVTTEEIKSVEKGSKDEKVILARKKVQKIILTNDGRPKGSWTPDRCLQFLLMCLAEKVPAENAQDFGFKQATMLKSNLAIILNSVLIDPSTICIVSFGPEDGPKKTRKMTHENYCEFVKELNRVGRPEPNEQGEYVDKPAEDGELLDLLKKFL